MKHYTIAAAAALVAVAALTGCSGGNTVSQATAAPAGAAAPAASTPTPTPTPTAQGVAKFGETVTFPSGVAVTAVPAVVVADQYASGAVEGKIVTITLTITNGSKATLNASMMAYPNVTYGAAGTPAPSAVDMQNGIGTVGSMSAILPGETRTAKVGVGIPAASFGDVRLQVSGPTFDDQPAIFKGAVQ